MDVSNRIFLKRNLKIFMNRLSVIKYQLFRNEMEFIWNHRVRYFLYPLSIRITKNNLQQVTRGKTQPTSRKGKKRNERIDYTMESEQWGFHQACHFSAESDERLMRCMCCFPESIYAVTAILVRLSAHPSLSNASRTND